MHFILHTFVWTWCPPMIEANTESNNLLKVGLFLQSWVDSLFLKYLKIDKKKQITLTLFVFSLTRVIVEFWQIFRFSFVSFIFEGVHLIFFNILFNVGKFNISTSPSPPAALPVLILIMARIDVCCIKMTPVNSVLFNFAFERRI